jgi:hypothetical protein
VSIDFTMRRVTPDTYEQAISENTVPEEYVTESTEISKDWGQLLHILAGRQTQPPYQSPPRRSPAVQQRWRAVNPPHLVALVRAGACFERGVLVEREQQRAA